MTDNTPLTLPAPLYEDPIYSGPTDPVVIWHRERREWWMCYTQRRSSQLGVDVSSVHGTSIGLATSRNLADWLYRGSLPLPLPDGEFGRNTFWAPEIMYGLGRYHMYVSYITGVPAHWRGHSRQILHYSSENLWDWRFESRLKLSSDRVIDACVYEVAPGRFKMWYKDEANHSHSYAAVSEDLHHWEVLGPEITDCGHEGPNVFELGGLKWMITDCWDGMGVYATEDFAHWTRQEGNLLREPGTRPGDGTIGNHGDVLVHGDRAILFYFTHPDYPRELRGKPGHVMTEQEARTVVQAAELYVRDGRLVCDRNRGPLAL